MPLRPRTDPQLADDVRRRLESLCRPPAQERGPGVGPVRSQGWVPSSRPAAPREQPSDGPGTDGQEDEEGVLRPAVGKHRPPVRWSVGPAAVRGLALVVLAALVVGAAFAWHARPTGLEAVPSAGTGRAVPAGMPAAEPPSPASTDASAPAAAPVPSTPSGTAPAFSLAGPSGGGPPPALTVHVAGQVRRPGVVTLPAGSRVVDAVEAAGGAAPSADLARVNLARPLVDGEQVLVLAPGESPPPAAAVPPGSGDPGAASAHGAAGVTAPPTEAAPVDLNTATLAELDALPGVGPVLAQRIIDWREANGGFRTVEDLQDVGGIGPTRFAELRPLVTA